MGILNGTQNSYNAGMGGLGISNANPWIMNAVNPAFLPLNNFTIFDVGLTMENRSISMDTLRESKSTGSLDYFALSVPLVAGKVGISLGFRPYSTVNFTSRTLTTLEGTNNPVEYIFDGQGGISSAYLSGGVKVWKYLYAGFKTTLLFGSKTENTFVNVLPAAGNATVILNSSHYRSTRFSDFAFSGSLGFQKNIGKDLILGAGVVYDMEADVNTLRTERLESRRNLDSFVSADTLREEDQARTLLPGKLGTGISISKMFKWTFGVDFYYQDWANYRNFENLSEGLGENYKIIVGGEYIPDYSSVNNYFKRMTYMFGIDYEQLPIVYNGVAIADVGITFGMSLPVGGASSMNLSGKFGSTAFNDASLIQENYFRLTLGISFNDRSFGWYRNQRKFN